ncbi:MAG: UPF0149 family protein [Gammaproteobacteria bacterium]|nr:UPF0149 family protein [Gammaproteobacteria bacterium]
MTYVEMQAVLDSLGSAVGAAEAHGCLCGALCAREGYTTPEWIADLFDAGTIGRIDDRSHRVLQEFHQATLEALQSQGFGFTPLIPDGEVTLDERVGALAAWSGGFLYGIGAGGADHRIAELDEVGEVLQDFSEIARARLDPLETPESGEVAFTELFEYLRAGAQLAFEELAALRASQSRPDIVVH